jgi:hypothetical protein
MKIGMEVPKTRRQSQHVPVTVLFHVESSECNTAKRCLEEILPAVRAMNSECERQVQAVIDNLGAMDR